MYCHLHKITKKIICLLDRLGSSEGSFEWTFEKVSLKNIYPGFAKQTHYQQCNIAIINLNHSKMFHCNINSNFKTTAIYPSKTLNKLITQHNTLLQLQLIGKTYKMLLEIK